MRKDKKKKIKRKNGHKLLLLLIIATIILGVWFGLNIAKNGGGLEGVIATILGEPIEKDESISVLVLGVSKDISVTLTDTIMVCEYNPRTNKASMMSISRDTFVGRNEATAKATDKLNSIYAQSGIDGVLKKVNKITGLDLENYIIVNNNALIEIVDSIGGVEFDVPIDMEYDDPTQDLHIRLKKGVQEIDGEEAEWLLRFRHNNDGSSYPAEYGDNDTGRMKTQRDFIKATVDQAISFKNVFRINRITNAIFDNVETNLDKEIIYSYVPNIINFDMESLKQFEFPTTPKICNELWFNIVDEDKAEDKLLELDAYLNEM